MNNTRRVFSRVLNIGCRSCSEFAQYIGSVSTVVYLVVPSKHSKQYHSLLERPDNTFECAFICTLRRYPHHANLTSTRTGATGQEERNVHRL